MSTAPTLRSRAVARLGRRHIAGTTLAEALTCADRLALPFALSYWDGPREPAGEIEGRWHELAAALARERRDAYVSVKLPPLGERAARAVAADALARGVRVHFDSHAERETERTLAAALALAPAPAGTVGITLPGAWSRSDRDLERAREAGLRVRLVKGQWPGDRDPADGLLELAALAARPGQAIALATHNPRLLEAALARLDGSGADVELELLYGLPARDAFAIARERTLPVRVYLPYGYGWVPYVLATLVRRPAAASLWLARDLAAVLVPGRALPWPH